jgi:similar to stage IV sporulation protein
LSLAKAGYWLKGYVLVEVRGKNPERLVNLCTLAGFPVWGFSAGEGSVFFYTTLPKYRSIHRLARKSRCVPRVRRRFGLPFIMSRVKKRPIFLLMAALMLVALIYMAGATWSIQVKGNETVSEEDILMTAASAGLMPGARKSALSPSAIEAALLNEHPELTWAYVHFQGTLAVIEVVEKTRPSSELPGDVVAAKDGVVTSVLVLSGTPVVSPGQTVRAGDVLIAGSPGDARTGARGTVVALTWYEVYRETDLYDQISVRTGRKTEAKVLRYGKTEFMLSGKHNMFEWYEVEDYPEVSLFKGTDKELTILSRVFYETQWVPRKVTEEEALRVAKQEAMEAIERKLPSSVKLVDLSCETLRVQEGLIGVRLVLSVEEDIGRVRPWPEIKDLNGG